jgi:hypothetical protein
MRLIRTEKSKKVWEGESLVELDLRLVPEEPLLIDKSRELFTAPGGFVVAMKEETGMLSGAGPDLDHTKDVTFPPDGPLDSYQPAAHCIVHCAFRRKSSVSIERNLIQQIPLACDTGTVWNSGEDQPFAVATAGPPALPLANAADGVMVGLQGPVDVVDLVVAAPPGFEIQRHVLIAGHFINFLSNPGVAAFMSDPSAHPLDRWHLTVRDHSTGQNVLDEDLPVRSDWPGFGGVNIFGANPDGRLSEFHYARRVPDAFTFGHLTLELQLGSLQFFYDTEVELAPVDVLHFPLYLQRNHHSQSTLHMGNGPAEPGDMSNDHNGDMHMRYAYDLGHYSFGNSAPVGKASNLSDFYSFGDPILCVADGTVIRVEDSVPDQLPGDPSKEPNRVVVRHDHADGPRYSVYAHCQQGSAAVQVGDNVNAGDRLANVGCNGSSSAPHLHLGYYTFDSWGHLRMLPIAFAFSDGAGGSVVGVAQSELNLKPAPPPQPQSTSGSSSDGIVTRVVGAAQALWDGVVHAVRKLFG